jgi:predicted 3-demethylubiquinone-9 3-methyltransferase (glyoxalase superfamily)
MPPSTREKLRDSWYRGRGASLPVNVADPLYGGPAPRIAFPCRLEPKTWLVRQMASKVASEPMAAADPVQWPPDAPGEGNAPRDRFEGDARGLIARPARFVAVFPDATLLGVRVDGAREPEDLVYTMVRNRSHANIDFMFLENDFLIPSEDTLHVVRGFAVARPTLFLCVSSDDLAAFFDAWRALGPDDETWAWFLDRFGVRRTDAAFWPTFDVFNTGFRWLDPLGAGILDLLRYGND